MVYSREVGVQRNVHVQSTVHHQSTTAKSEPREWAKGGWEGAKGKAKGAAGKRGKAARQGRGRGRRRAVVKPQRAQPNQTKQR